MAVDRGCQREQQDDAGSERQERELTASELQHRLRMLTGEKETPSKLHILASDLHELGLPDLSTREGKAVIEAVLDETADPVFLNARAWRTRPRAGCRCSNGCCGCDAKEDCLSHP
jgi:hypothetical protein